MTTNDGGPAFPIEADYIRNDKGDGYKMNVEHSPGMSLRDYFAAAAMTGIRANALNDDSTYADNAEDAYHSAYAMLKVRKRKNDGGDK